jgi:hypothetical protein
MQVHASHGHVQAISGAGDLSRAAQQLVPSSTHCCCQSMACVTAWCPKSLTHHPCAASALGKRTAADLGGPPEACGATQPAPTQRAPADWVHSWEAGAPVQPHTCDRYTMCCLYVPQQCTACKRAAGENNRERADWNHGRLSGRISCHASAATRTGPCGSPVPSALTTRAGGVCGSPVPSARTTPCMLLSQDACSCARLASIELYAVTWSLSGTPPE